MTPFEKAILRVVAGIMAASDNPDERIRAFDLIYEVYRRNRNV